MRFIPLFLLGVLLLSGCCGEFQSAYDQALASDRKIECGSGRDSGVYRCSYIKAEGNTVHLTITASYVDNIQTLSIARSNLSGGYFTESWDVVRTHAYSSAFSSLASGNRTSPITGLDFHPMDCKILRYQIEDRDLNFTIECNETIPEHAVYMLKGYAPVYADESAMVGLMMDAGSCGVQGGVADCDLPIRLIAEKR